jgi:hypothetical protein
MNLRKTAIAGALIATVGAGVAPAASLAATTPTVAKTYNIGVAPLILKQGHTVKVDVKVTNPQASVKQWWSRATVQNVVRQGVDGLYMKPFYSEGYRCVPTITGANGSIAKFTCTLRGADVPTSAKLTFTAAYAKPVSDQ